MKPVDAQEPIHLSAAEARAWWRALMENVVGLIEDSFQLLNTGSAARARSLGVLALEELGKASLIYRHAESVWTLEAREVHLPEDFEKWARWHPSKLQEALLFGEDLDAFWGNHSDLSYYSGLSLENWAKEGAEDRKRVSGEMNRQKQAGFYVDRGMAGELSTPATAFSPGECLTFLTRLAQVAEMLLIRDHTRMKPLPENLYDSTHDLQFRLLPCSHPEDFQRAFGHGAPC